MATDLVEVDEWTATITVPEDGDDYDAASVELPFQGITNRTVRLNSKIDAVPDEAHTWSDVQTFEDGLALSSAANELAYLPQRVRTIILPQTLACPRFGSAIKLMSAGVANPFGWMWESAGTELIYTFRLPHGATLQRVRVGVGASVGADAIVHCYQLEAAVDTDYVAGITTVHDLGSTTVGITDASQLVTHTVPSPLATDGRYHTYAIDVTLMAVASVCALVEVQFLDPGPRNF